MMDQCRLTELTLVQVILFCLSIPSGGTSNSFIRENHLYVFNGSQWLDMGMNFTSPEVNKVKVKVYYETLCPGSINFLMTQLRPAAEKLGPYLDIHMVPYGHARTREIYGQYEFECQHGPQECFGNKIHACAVDVLKNNTQAALFNACIMQYSNFKRDPRFDYNIVINWCNYKLGIQTKGIWACINGERGSILLKTYGEETRAVGLRYIPYVLIDDSTEKQDEATRDLSSTVCRMLTPTPDACFYSRR